ncbi:MAG: hypothetical protein AAF823_12975 [Planctomycetota bacterium]
MSRVYMRGRGGLGGRGSRRLWAGGAAYWFAAAVGGAGLLVGSAALAEVPGAEGAAEAPGAAGADTTLAAERFVVRYVIGNSSTRDENRRVGHGLSRSAGWSSFVRLKVRPLIDAGFTRFMLHNPFGAIGGERMEFDQYVDAKAARLGWLTDDFVEAWRPVTRGDYSDGRPIEVIGYLGDLDGDTTFVELRDADDRAGWLRRATVSVSPLLDAGMSVGFDSASKLPEGSPEYGLIRLLNGLGVRTYVEPRPHKTVPHLWTQNVIALNRGWRRSDPARVASNSAWAATNEQLTGEIVRIVRFPQGDLAGQLDHARQAWADGHTVAWTPELIAEHGWTWADLLHRPIEGVGRVAE